MKLLEIQYSENKEIVARKIQSYLQKTCSYWFCLPLKVVSFS